MYDPYWRLKDPKDLTDEELQSAIVWKWEISPTKPTDFDPYTHEFHPARTFGLYQRLCGYRTPEIEAEIKRRQPQLKMIEYTYRTKLPNSDDVKTGAVTAETSRRAVLKALQEAFDVNVDPDIIWFTGSPFEHSFGYPVVELKEVGMRSGINYVCFDDVKILDRCAKHVSETFKRIFGQ